MSSKKTPIPGERYGSYTVIGEVVPSPYYGNRTAALVRCDCGHEQPHLYTSLKQLRGKKGCCDSCKRRDDFTLTPPQNAQYNAYRKNAVGRGLAFELSKEDFLSLIVQDCHYCGAPPTPYKIHAALRQTSLVMNGIDRKDNNIGYTLSNSVPCCKDCNYMKREHGYVAFLARIKAIGERHKLWA